MKCVMMSASYAFRAGVIRRVNNEEADRLVNSGVAVFCPKKLWKAQQKKAT